jgi:hypothetical protein
MPKRRFRDELFQLPQRDDQLILAVAQCLADRERVRTAEAGAVIGVRADELFRWLHYRAGTSVAHPNIDYRWNSLRELQTALRGLARRKLLRGRARP